MISRGFLGVTIASLMLLSSFSMIVMRASCSALHDPSNGNVTGTTTSEDTIISSIKSDTTKQDASTESNGGSKVNKRLDSLDESVLPGEPKRTVAHLIKTPRRYRERVERPCPASTNPFTKPLQETTLKASRPRVSVEIKELLRRINLEESDLPDEVLLELNDRQIRRELEQSTFNLDPFMEWLTFAPGPEQPTRLHKMINGEADEYGEDDWLKMFERKGDGFKELRNKKNRPILDEFFYYELSRKMLQSPKTTSEQTPLRKMVLAIRAARRMYLWGTCYLIWSQRESLVMLPHAIGFTASAMCLLWAALLVLSICWCVWREARVDMMALVNADHALGYTKPSWFFLLGTLTGWEYLWGVARYCLWGTSRPNLEKALRKHQPTRWWDILYNAPQVGDWRDLVEGEGGDGRGRSGREVKKKRQASSFVSSRRNSPSSSPDATTSEGSEGEQQERNNGPLALERILPGKKNKSLGVGGGRPVAKPATIPRASTPPQQQQQQQAQQQPEQRHYIRRGTSSVPFVKYGSSSGDALRRSFVVPSTIPSTTTTTAQRSAYAKPAVPDAPFKPAMSFADAMVGVKTSAPSSAMPSGASSPPPGMSSRASSSTRRRSRLLPFIMEEDAQNNVEEEDLASTRSLRSSTSSVTLNSEFMSGFASPSFSLFSNSMLGGAHAPPTSASTDTPADNLLMDILLRRGRQHSLEEEEAEEEEDEEEERESASDSEFISSSRFSKSRTNRPL